MLTYMFNWKSNNPKYKSVGFICIDAEDQDTAFKIFNSFPSLKNTKILSIDCVKEDMVNG